MATNTFSDHISFSKPGKFDPMFCKSHSDEDISQKGLSVLNILSFLHPNLFYTVDPIHMFSILLD